MSILTRYNRASSPENPLTSFGDLFRLRSVKPLFDLRDRLKIMSGWGAHRGIRKSPLPASDHEQLEHALATLGIDDLIATEIPERELLLDPILPAKGLMMIHARRGGSKTFLALAMGLAVAGGTSLLRWSVPKARRVLHVDGEMTLIDLQKRVAALKAGIGVTIQNDHFRLLAADHTDVPDLATEAGQRALDPSLDGVDLLIVDNISTPLLQRQRQRCGLVDLDAGMDFATAAAGHRCAACAPFRQERGAAGDIPPGGRPRHCHRSAAAGGLRTAGGCEVRGPRREEPRRTRHLDQEIARTTIFPAKPR
jgi:hypothetical protein